MRAFRATLLLAICLGLAVSDRAVAQQQDDVELTARTHFAAGEYQQALDIYAKLYAQTLHPTYLRNVGRCYQNMGKPDEAISSFHEYLRKAENLDPKQRADVEGFIREMEDLKRQRELANAPPTAPAAPTPAITTAPPPPSATQAETSDRVAASLTAGPPVAQDQASRPIYKRWWFWTAIAVVAAGGITTALVLSSSPNAPTATTTFGTKGAQPQ